MDYRVEERDGCTLIFGAAPLDVFVCHSNRLPETAVLDQDLARMAGANFALGLPEDTAKLKETLSAEVLRKTQARYSGKGLSDGLVRWLAIGEQGLSSVAMAQHLAGIQIPGAEASAHPRDPSDLARCRRLLEQCPELRPHLPTMASLSEVWGRLAAEWDSLCQTMDDEVPQWRDRQEGYATRTYERMKALGC